MLASTDNEVVIAVMGVTGAGKSTFINRALGTEKAYISHELQPGTHEVQSYRFAYKKTNFVLVDTPGFDDTNVSDADILRTLLQWLHESYGAGQKLTAIIYLHRITDVRMQGSALRNLLMFKKLCGEGCFANVILGTTFWSSVVKNPGLVVAEGREKELVSTKQFWGGMVDKGSEVVRIPEHQQLARDLLFRLANKSKITLQAQEELSVNGKSFDQTTACKSLREDLEKERAEAARVRERMKEEHEYRLKAIETKRKAEEEARRKEHDRKVAEQERERIRMEKERERLEAEKKRREEDAKREMERLKREQQELEERMAKLKIDRENEARSKKGKQFWAEVEEWLEVLVEGKAAGKIFCNFRDVSSVYNRVCDNCFKSIGASTYYLCATMDNSSFAQAAMPPQECTAMTAATSAPWRSMLKKIRRGIVRAPRNRILQIAALVAIDALTPPRWFISTAVFATTANLICVSSALSGGERVRNHGH